MPSWNVVSVMRSGGHCFRTNGMTEPKARAEFDRRNPTGEGKVREILLTHRGIVIDSKPKKQAAASGEK